MATQKPKSIRWMFVDELPATVCWDLQSTGNLDYRHARSQTFSDRIEHFATKTHVLR